jgi:hypothetical protein
MMDADICNAIRRRIAGLVRYVVLPPPSREERISRPLLLVGKAISEN